jgi:predicted nucleotidyltransferase
VTPAEIRRTLADALTGADRGVASAYLFGSVAEGRSHRESDVDVGVLLDRDVFPSDAARFDARLRLIGQLSAALGRDVDVVVLNDAPPQFARRVVTTGDRFVEHDAAADRAFRRLTLSRAADLEPFLKRMRAIKLASLDR